MHVAKFRRNQAQAARCLFPSGFALPATICHNTCKVLPAREAHPSLVSRAFTGFSHVDTQHRHDRLSAIQTLGPQRQEFIINHNVSINCLIKLVPHGPRPQACKISNQVEYYKSSQLISPELHKG